MRSAIFVEMSSKTPGATMSSGRFSRAASLCRFSGFTIAYLQGDERGGEGRCNEIDDAGARKGVGREEEHEATGTEKHALHRGNLVEEEAADRGGHQPHAGNGRR